MGKRVNKTPAARISRSGLWLIGGVALLSLAVLAWALQGDGTTGVQAFRRSGPARTPARARARPFPLPNARTPERPNTRRPTPHVAEELAARPPSVDDYGPLLHGNVFQPRVVPPQSRSAAKSPASERPPAAGHRGGVANGGPVTADGWHDWKYSGIAELDQQTYALMDQPDKKQSQFVKAGDHVEDATIVSVAENEVTLRQADGSIVHMKRVDPVADQLRSLRAATTPLPGAAPAAPGALSPALVPGQGTMAPFPNGQAAPQQPAAGYNPPAGGAFGRRGRRFQQDGAGDAGVQ